MKIKDIFVKDLFRAINGVVKADQQDDAIVWQELDEYVVTRELDQHFRKFFEAYTNAIINSHDPNVAGRIGVWVSGFFGSGKSHFIKILSYLLGNKVACNPYTGETRKAVEFFDNKIKDPMLLADIKKATQVPTDVILFNIDSKADSREGRSAILSVFWRVFNEMQGFCGDAPHIAEMEKYLTAKGKYEEFCQHYEQITGENWQDERDAYHFKRDEIIEVLSRTLGQSKQSATEWFDRAEDNFRMTIEGFARKVREYLDGQGPEHRIVFLVDEVGQFIGNDVHLMLNLQTIVEKLGELCLGRAWVVVTSQEDIDAVLGDLKAAKANDFSKIQGRFHTRLSLSSSNTDEVIQARLLEKTDEAGAVLEKLFTTKGDILKSQLSFSHDSATLKNFKDETDFIKNYPFAPYHFQLVQKIFESIRKAGATGLHLSRGERSMLDAFQSAAKNIADQNIGVLVPLYQFYPAIESFLDTAVKRTIDQANDNDSLEKPFDINLLRTLFLIRYVDIIKPNVDNLVTLFIDQVDADRIALKRKIEEGLQRLEKETLISRNGDLYFFLTNEEREIKREIKNVEIAAVDETKLLAEIIFEDILKGQTRHRFKPYQRDYAYNRLLDGHPWGSKLEQEIFLEILTPFSDEYTKFNDAKCILYSSENSGRLFIKLEDNDELGRELRTYLQTDNYIRFKSDAALSSTVKKILLTHQEENRERRNRLIALLEKMLLNGSFYVLGQTLEIKADTPRAAVAEALDYIVQNLYNKFGYLRKLHSEPQKEIKAVLLATDLGQKQLQLILQEVNAEAVKEVREYINLLVLKNHPVILKDLVEHFTRRPYGWPEWEIILILARIFMAGEIKFLMDGAALESKEAVGPLLKSSNWKNIKIIKAKNPGQADIEKARKLCQELFGKIGPETPKDLINAIKKEFLSWQRELSQYYQLAQTGQYPGAKEMENGLDLIQKFLKIKDNYEFINTFNKKKDDLLDLSDDIHEVLDFYKNQRTVWEKLKKALVEFKQNEDLLIKNETAKASLIKIKQVAEAPAPYGLLKDVESHISAIDAINKELVAGKQAKIMAELEREINMLLTELDKLNADADFRNNVLYPLQKIKSSIQEETSIPRMSFYQDQFEEELERAWDKIEQAKLSSDPAKSEKVIKTIKLSSVAPRIYLESEEEVEKYVNMLKEKLLSALEENVRIRVEF